MENKKESEPINLALLFLPTAALVIGMTFVIFPPAGLAMGVFFGLFAGSMMAAAILTKLLLHARRKIIDFVTTIGGDDLTTPGQTGLQFIIGMALFVGISLTIAIATLATPITVAGCCISIAVSYLITPLLSNFKPVLRKISEELKNLGSRIKTYFSKQQSDEPFEPAAEKAPQQNPDRTMVMTGKYMTVRLQDGTVISGVTRMETKAHQQDQDRSKIMTGTDMTIRLPNGTTVEHVTKLIASKSIDNILRKNQTLPTAVALQTPSAPPIPSALALGAYMNNGGELLNDLNDLRNSQSKQPTPH